MSGLEQLPDAARQVFICHNVRAGARSREALIDRLRQELALLAIESHVLTDIEALSSAADEARRQGDLRAVVAAGGDGTASLLVHHLSADTPLAVLPLGTENLLSKYLGQTADPRALAHRIAAGQTLRLDAGCANGRLFLLMLGCGFDADVVQRLHASRRGHIRHTSYFKPILAAIRSYRYPELRITCLDEADAESEGATTSSDAKKTAKTSWRGRWAFVVNLPRYAGGLQFVPQADGTDGLLDVCTFRSGSIWNGLRYLCGVVVGRHLSWSDVRYRRVRRLRIECDEPVGYQLDGDPGGQLPVDVQVVPGRLNVVVQEEWARKMGFAGNKDPSRIP